MWTPPYSLFSKRKFYVEYDQDAGMPMTCHIVINAENLSDAKKNWIDLIRKKGYACSPMGTLPYRYNKLFEVPAWMNDYNILREFGK